MVKKIVVNIKEWKVLEVTGWGDKTLPPLPAKEKRGIIKFLRNNNYPKPVDCPADLCPGVRPSCGLGVCYVAVKLCNDF